MPLSSLAKRQKFIENGLSPDDYDYDENLDGFTPKAFPGVDIQEDNLTTSPTALPVRATPTKLGSAGRSFFSGLLPTAASIGGGVGAATLASGLVSGPAAPIVMPVAGGIGALLSGLLASKAQAAILPDAANEALALDAQTNPWSSLAGGIAAAGPFLKPGVEQIKQVGSGLANLTSRFGGVPTAVTPAQTAALVNTAIQAAPPAVRAIQGDYTPAMSAVDFAANMVLAKPTALGRKVGLGDSGLDEQYKLFEEAKVGKEPISTAYEKDLAIERQKAEEFSRVASELKEAEAEQIRMQELAEARDITKQMRAEAERLRASVKEKVDAEELNAVASDLASKQAEAQEASLRAAAVELKQKTGVPLEEDPLATSLDKTAAAGVKNPGEVPNLTPEEIPPMRRAQEDIEKFEVKSEPDKPLVPEDRGLPTTVPQLPEGQKKIPFSFQDARDEVSAPATKGLLDYFTKLGANFRGIKTKVTGEIVNDRGQKARGVSVIEEGTNDLLSTVSAKMATGDTIPHEQFHFFWDYLKNNPSGKMQEKVSAIRKEVEATPEFKAWEAKHARGVDEYIVNSVGQGIFKRVAGKKATDGMRDAFSAVKSRLGKATIDDYARLLGRKYLFDEKIDLKGKTGGEGAKTQDPLEAEDSRLLISQTESEFLKDRPFRLKPMADGSYNSAEVLSAVKKFSAAEQFAVKPLIEVLEKTTDVTKEDVLGILRNTVAKIGKEEFSYKEKPEDPVTRGVIAKYNKALEDKAKMRHEWFDNLSGKDQLLLYVSELLVPEGVGKANAVKFVRDLRRDGFPEQELPKALEYYKLQEAIVELRASVRLRADLLDQRSRQPLYPGISNKTKSYMQSHDYTESAVTSEGLTSNTIHDPFPADTLVHTRHYTTSPKELSELDSRFKPEDRVVHVVEVQSDAKAEDRGAMTYFENFSVDYNPGFPAELSWTVFATDARDNQRMAIESYKTEAEAQLGLQQIEQRRQRQLELKNYPLFPETNRIGIKSVIAEVIERNKTLPEGQKIKFIAIPDAETVMMSEGHFDKNKLTIPIGTEVGDILVAVSLPNDQGSNRAILVKKQALLIFKPRLAKATDAKLLEASREFVQSEYKDNSVVGLAHFATKADLAPVTNEGMQHNYASSARLVDKLSGEELGRFATTEEAKRYVDFYTKNKQLPENALDAKDGSLLIIKGDLHSIAQEITGDAGKVVDFGEHELFRYSRERIPGKIETKFFTDSEGKPLTAKAKVYSLDLPLAKHAAGEKLTISGKRFQDALEEATVTKKPSPVMTFIAPQVDKVRALGGIYKEIGDAASAFFNRRDQYEARFIDVLHKDLKNEPTEEVSEALTYARDRFRNEPSNARPNTKSMDLIQAFFKDVRKLQNEEKLPVLLSDGTTREGKLSDYYAPDMLNDKTIRTFVQDPISAESEGLIKEWVDYEVKASGKNAVEVEKNIRDYINSLASGVKTTIEFNALTKAQGYGLPENLRETDPWKLLSKYGGRAAKTLAFWKELQNNPTVAGSLKLHQPDGKLSPLVEGTKAVAGQEDTDALMRFVLNDFNTNKHPKINSTIRAINNMLFGLPTGLRDLAATPGIASSYIPVKDSGVFLEAAVKVSDFLVDSLATGARNGRLDLKRFRGLAEPDGWTKRMNRVAEGARKYQGRDFLEQGARIYTFGLGKLEGQIMLARAAKGDEEAIAWLKNFSELIDTPMEKWGNAELNQVAKNFVDKVQGTFDARGLPMSIIDSPFAPFLTLQKWGVERFNNFRKDVVLPATKGNIGPLAKSLLSSVLTGAAIQSLTELLSSKKPPQATLTEAEAKENLEYQTAAALSLLQLGAFGGILGDVVKAGVDVGIYRQAPRLAGFPAADSIAEVGQAVTDAFNAVDNGQDPAETLLMISAKLLTRHVQNLNYAANWLQPEETQRKNNERDLRVFRSLEGAGKPFTFGNSFTSGASGKKEKDFKRTEDLAEAAELAKELVENAVKKSTLPNGNIDIERLRRVLASLKTSPEKEVPTEPQEASRFSEFVGKDQFLQRYQEAQKRKGLMAVKKQMVPSV